MYQARKYREEINKDRFRFFSSVYLESDLLVGVSHEAYKEEMARCCRDVQVRLHDMILSHSKMQPAFLESLEPLAFPGEDGEIFQGIDNKVFLANEDKIFPVENDKGLPGELRTLYRCGMTAGTGPMAAVAGLFARETGKALENDFHPEELIVENGGDLYLENRKDLLIAIHAGNSALSDKIGLVIPPGKWGICTSSGTLGHSFSRGRADALTVVAKDAALADAWATSLANRVRDNQDIDKVLDMSREHPEILSCVVILGDRMGIRGNFDLKPIS